MGVIAHVAAVKLEKHVRASATEKITEGLRTSFLVPEIGKNERRWLAQKGVPPAQRGKEVGGDLHDGRQLSKNAVQVGGGDEFGAGAGRDVERAIYVCKNVLERVDVLDLVFEIRVNDLVRGGHVSEERKLRG